MTETYVHWPALGTVIPSRPYQISASIRVKTPGDSPGCLAVRARARRRTSLAHLYNAFAPRYAEYRFVEVVAFGREFDFK